MAGSLASEPLSGPGFQAIYRFLVDNGWGLLEMTGDAGDLEQVFMALTAGEAA